MNPEPLFVIGVWRSGTTLLHTLLNQHPQIRLMYESDLPLLWPLFLIPRKNNSWLSKWELWNAAVSRHGIDTSQIPDACSGVSRAMRAVCQQYAGRKGATIWGCKSPNYYDRVNALAKAFPNAKFIIIWRGLADVCRSIAKAAEQSPWFSRRGTELRAILAYHRLKLEIDRLSRRNRAIHELHYEQLTEDPSMCMKAICDFLGIPFDPRMASLDDADRSAVYNGEHHKRVKGATIAPSTRRPEVLRPELKAKIDRYIAYWRKQYDGKWPTYPKVDSGCRPAPTLERLSDRVWYRVFRSWDLLTPLVYLAVPADVWAKYRRLKQRQSPEPHTQ
jgi:hypothetical protein